MVMHPVPSYLLPMQATGNGPGTSLRVCNGSPHSRSNAENQLYDPARQSDNVHPCRPQADGEESDAEVDQKRLRIYERSKLRYYFAVVECDSVATASNLYVQCDGLEFELTANRSGPAYSTAIVCLCLALS